ncbi:MAG: hypothetical protein PHP70_02990 [Gallionella sp.]|nr:hypothetical protein [Gallionella sp.]
MDRPDRKSQVLVTGGDQTDEPWLVPSNETLLELFYLALNNISKKWTMLTRD